MNFELNAERSELSRIISEGFDFSVEAEVVERVPWGPWGLLRRRKAVRRKYDFHIPEPTLGMLDRMSREWIELAIEDESMKGLDEMSKARRWVAKDARRCARIVAIAVSEREATKERLDELTDLFMNTIRPSQLYQLMVYISLTNNLGDFSNSIRLMCASRTTMPTRIEDTGEA